MGIKNLKLSGPNNRGIPDRAFYLNGDIVFAEFKAPGKKPTTLQDKRIRELRADGFEAHWFDNEEKCLTWLRWVLVKEFEI